MSRSQTRRKAALSLLAGLVLASSAKALPQRIAASKFSLNGVPLAPAEKTIAMGPRVAEFRASVTVEAIRKALTR